MSVPRLRTDAASANTRMGNGSKVRIAVFHTECSERLLRAQSCHLSNPYLLLRGDGYSEHDNFATPRQSLGIFPKTLLRSASENLEALRRVPHVASPTRPERSVVPRFHVVDEGAMV